MTKFKEWSIESNVDLLVGGTPCQSFSVAGLRKGLDDPRGNLMLTYLAIADKYRPKWLVWENVPGVLSSNGGHDFASFLRGLGELGYGFAYRVLDAQYFGVAQRRRRVFVVGYLGDWQRAAAVLFERDSLCGNPAPSRQKRESVASYTPSSFGGYSQESGTLRANGGDLGGGSENLLVDKQWPADISSSLDTTFGTKMGLENQHVNAGCPMFVPAEVTTVQTLRARRPGEGGMSHDHEHIVPVLSPALNTQSGANHAPDTKAYIVQPVAYNITFCDANGTRSDRPNGGLYVSETDVSSTMTKAGIGTNVAQPMAVDGYNQTLSTTSQTIRADKSDGDHVGMVMQSMAVRRLTPVECERLQGFPDTYTDIMSKGKATPDGPRYKALGNSMAVPVMAWIGNRIQQVENLKI
jgi:DNA (cytosine-5)-methyltransferase 1